MESSGRYINDYMQGGDSPVERKWFRKVINYLPAGPLRCLDLGSGVCFEFERMLLQSGKARVVDCVDRYEHDKITELPKHVNYIQGSVEEELSFEKKYDCIFCFEVIEHIDRTDWLIKNCYNNLKENGLLFISWPNLASFYSRVELLMGYQPHFLEISNEYANLGSGIFGKLNNPTDKPPVHHIRGITYKAMRELLMVNGFRIEKAVGCDKTNLLSMSPRISSVVLFICSKKI